MLERHQINPPDEAYEATWMEAKAILDEAGPDGAFVLLVVNRAEEEGEDMLEHRFAFSTGRKQIGTSYLYGLMWEWMVGSALPEGEGVEE